MRSNSSLRFQGFRVRVCQKTLMRVWRAGWRACCWSCTASSGPRASAPCCCPRRPSPASGSQVFLSTHTYTSLPPPCTSPFHTLYQRTCWAPANSQCRVDTRRYDAWCAGVDAAADLAWGDLAASERAAVIFDHMEGAVGAPQAFKFLARIRTIASKRGPGDYP